MYQHLSQYLFLYKHLNIPGVGTFVLMPKQANANFTSRSIKAPGWDLLFMQSIGENISNNNDVYHQNNLYNWLSSNLGISKQEATLQFDDFSDSIKHRLQNNEKIEWEEIGTLVKDGEHISLTTAPSLASPFTEVKAEKIIRENANHNVLVGERETTTDVMREELFDDEKRYNTGRTIVLIILISSIAALAWYLFSDGMKLSSIGNKNTVEVSKPTETYKMQ